MLPDLIKPDGSGDGPLPTSPATLVPPLRFKAIEGPIQDVRYNASRPYYTATGETPAQKTGLRYERDVQTWLQTRFPDYRAGGYIHFRDGSTQRTCQPDGLLVLLTSVFIFEIKYQHMSDAWWQLEKLYKPLAQRLWFDKEICLVEVCRSYDPAVKFPCEVTLIKDISEWVSRPRKRFGVLQWRK